MTAEVNTGISRDQKDMEHLRLLMAFALAYDSNCIDIGCHAGDVLRDMIKYAPAGHHIAYEPLPDYSARLQEAFPQAEVRQAAVSNHSGTKSFTYVRTNPAYSGFLERSYPRKEKLQRIDVQIEDIDSHLPAGYIPALIKIDVEGAEQEVIEGAIETITLHKPIVVFEHGKGASDLYSTAPWDIYDLLVTRAGLRIYDLDGNGPFSRDEFTGVFESNHNWNFVARR